MRIVLHGSIGLVLYSCVTVMPPAIAGTPDGLDAALHPYAKVSGISGTINSIGSDTLNNLMTCGWKVSGVSIQMSKSKSKAKGPTRLPPL